MGGSSVGGATHLGHSARGDPECPHARANAIEDLARERVDIGVRGSVGENAHGTPGRFEAWAESADHVEKTPLHVNAGDRDVEHIASLGLPDPTSPTHDAES